MYKGRSRTIITAVLLLTIGVVLGLVIAAMVQSYQSPNALEGWQSLLGSLLGALVTLFAGYLAWSAVRVQVDAESAAMQSQLNVIALQAASDTRDALLGRAELLRTRLETVREAYVEDVRGAISDVNEAIRNGSVSADTLSEVQYTILRFGTKASSNVWTEKLGPNSLRSQLNTITNTFASVANDLHVLIYNKSKGRNPDMLTDEQLLEMQKSLQKQFSQLLSDLHEWFNRNEYAAFAEVELIEQRVAQLDEFIVKKGVFDV